MQIPPSGNPLLSAPTPAVTRRVNVGMKMLIGTNNGALKWARLEPKRMQQRDKKK
jgi:hypothetical protein